MGKLNKKIKKLSPREILLELARKKYKDDNMSPEDIKQLTGWATPKQQRYFYRAMEYFEASEPQKWKK